MPPATPQPGAPKRDRVHPNPTSQVLPVPTGPSVTPGGLASCQLPHLSWRLPASLPLSPLTPPLLSGVALSADVPRPAWRPQGSTASVSISHLYGFKCDRTNLYFTLEDTIRPGCGPSGRVGSASARSPGPAVSISSPSHRTEQKEASGFTGPHSATKLGLDPGCGGPVHPHSSSGLNSVSSAMGYLRTRVHTPPSSGAPQVSKPPISGATGCLVCGHTANPALFTGPPHEAPTCTPCSRTSSL